MVPLACGIPLLFDQGVAEGGALDCQIDGCFDDDCIYWTQVRYTNYHSRD
jgi:hypothetical protein